MAVSDHAAGLILAPASARTDLAALGEIPFPSPNIPGHHGPTAAGPDTLPESRIAAALLLERIRGNTEPAPSDRPAGEGRTG